MIDVLRVQKRIWEKAEVRGVDPDRGIASMKIQRNESVLGELKEMALRA